jgi:hypothetical protein
LGFIVDVYDCKADNVNENIYYDLVLAFGKPYRNAKLSENGVRILYLTEVPPEFSFIEEKKRIKYFYDRHKVKVAVQRSGTYYVHSELEIANQIICLGERHAERIKESLGQDKIVHVITPTGLPV